MKQPVQHRGADSGVVVDIWPHWETPLVGGQNDAAFEIALCHDLKERSGSFAGEGQVAELIHDEQIGPANSPAPQQFVTRPARV